MKPRVVPFNLNRDDSAAARAVIRFPQNGLTVPRKQMLAIVIQ